MPSSLFGNKTNQISYSQPTTVDDPIRIVEDEIKQAGGNAEKAFYSLAKKKRVDPNSIIDQVKSMGDPSILVQNALSKNPRLGPLLRLVSLFK